MVMMPDFREVDIEQWAIFLKTVPEATFFHSPIWHVLWANFEDKTAKAFLFSDTEGNEVLFPFLEHKSRLGIRKHLTSSPRGTYGGFLVNGIFSKTIAHHVDQFLKKYYSYSIWQSPFTKQPIQINGASTTYTTQCILLDQGWPAILKGWTKGHKSAAIKGKRSGLIVREGKSKADWNTYYDLYDKSVHRWGEKARGHYPRSLFDEIQKIPNNHCKLWLAFDSLGEQMLYGSLCFYFNGHVVYWHGAGDQAFFDLKPSHYLQYNIIQNAIGAGYRIYDFNPSAGLIGVEKFKQGFGSVQKSGHCFTSS